MKLIVPKAVVMIGCEVSKYVQVGCSNTYYINQWILFSLRLCLSFGCTDVVSIYVFLSRVPVSNHSHLVQKLMQLAAAFLSAGKPMIRGAAIVGPGDI